MREAYLNGHPMSPWLNVRFYFFIYTTAGTQWIYIPLILLSFYKTNNIFARFMKF